MAPTIRDLILDNEVQEDRATKDRARAISEAKFIMERARTEGRTTLTDQEKADVEDCLAKRARADAEIKGIRDKGESLRQIKAAEEAVDEKLNERRSEVEGAARPADTAARPAYDRVARIGSEERTYHRGNAGKGGGFLKDVTQAFLYRDPQAEMRLANHMREERVERGQYLERAVGTGAFAGLTVPQYLTEMYAPATANLRPFADICNKHDLPADGMTVNISRITTPSAVVLQSAENAEVGENNLDDTLLTVNVQTAAGMQTISRQAIDRGTGIEDVVMDDLFRRYATTLDSTLLNQSSTGLAAVATATTFDMTGGTVAAFWPKLHGATAGLEAALLGFAQPSHVIMHSRRWYWLQSAVGTSWPFLGQPGIPAQLGGVNDGKGYNSGRRGVLPNGLDAIVDNNVAINLGAGTNQDDVYVVPQSECHLWEDPGAPVFIRAEQAKAANLGVLLVLYGYFAYTFGRYANGMAKINGTGLTTPTFGS